MVVSKSVLQDMDSSDHFNQEVFVTMTQLAEVITSANDSVFTVLFYKKINEQEVAEKLKSAELLTDEQM